jgi:Tol biopolymer transport system component
MVDIRRALDDDSQQLIRTVARRGSLFAAPVTAPLVVRHPALSPVESGAEPKAVARPPLTPVKRKLVMGSAALLLIAATGLGLARLTRPAREGLRYEQLTHFTDSAVSPALSPDGRMLAFIRSHRWFLSTDQVYVKLLPDGEPIQITHDPRQKYGLAFSPDGSRIAYTTVQAGVWRTNIVSPVGGDATELLSNAAGLTWLDPRHVLFSEIRAGQHMGMVTSAENRSEYRKIYFPRDERGMVHLSYASPDRKWALAVEMNPVWQPCRVVPLDGSSAGRQVGPRGKCTSAAWSPDGRWMYFGAEVDGKHHLWRQRFPAGVPEQITSGPTEEDGIAVYTGWALHNHLDRDSPERSVDSRCSRGPSTLVGRLRAGCGSRDGKWLFYLRRSSQGGATELWRADLESERSEAVLRGISVLEYDISDDAREAVFSTQPPGRTTQLWIATLDRSSPPRLLSFTGEDSPHFGRNGQILFRLQEGTTPYLARMNRDGSGRAKVAAYPVGNIEYISPDRRWITTISPAPEGGAATDGGTLAVPTEGGAPRWICRGCGLPAVWAPTGKFLYVGVRRESRESAARTIAIPIPPGESLPNLPPSGIQGLNIVSTIPGSRVIEAWNVSPGPDPSVFAYVKSTTHRNLFRIPLR